MTAPHNASSDMALPCWQLEAEGDNSSAESSGKENALISPSQADRVRRFFLSHWPCCPAVSIQGKCPPTVHEPPSAVGTLGMEGIAEVYLRQDAEAVRTRLSIEDKLVLESSEAWVQAPSALLVPSGGRNFEVKVHAGMLASAPPRGILLQQPQIRTNAGSAWYVAEQASQLTLHTPSSKICLAGRLQQLARGLALCRNLSDR